MRSFGIIGLLAALAAMPDPAAAGLVRKCRKACKPFVADCVATSGKSRRACKREILPRCKHEGLEVCSVTTTTTPTTVGGATTSTTTGPSGKGGGAMSLDVNDVSVQADGDQSLYTMSITIKYSVVTFDAVTQVALDPATFTVLDEDTGIVYQAEPAAAPEDCSADDVLSKDGPAITCTLRFVMPSSVGAPSPVDGGAHGKLRFESFGLHGSKYFS
jgi:hypothetical protein